MVISALTGFVAGLLHVLSGPDHLTAVAPIAANDHRRAWVTGLNWGLGHASGVLIVGSAALLLRGILPVDLLSSWTERLVGAFLIGIGIWGLRKALTNHVHAHEHTHGGERHVHIHVHARHSGSDHHGHTHIAFAVGTLHGLAGGSHYLGIVPALTFSNTLTAFTYVCAFGTGTILAMSIFSSVVGLLAKTCSFGGVNSYRVLMTGCSAAALSVGCYWLLE